MHKSQPRGIAATVAIVLSGALFAACSSSTGSAATTTTTTTSTTAPGGGTTAQASTEALVSSIENTSLHAEEALPAVRAIACRRLLGLASGLDSDASLPLAVRAHFRLANGDFVLAAHTCIANRGALTAGAFATLKGELKAGIRQLIIALKLWNV